MNRNKEPVRLGVYLVGAVLDAIMHSRSLNVFRDHDISLLKFLSHLNPKFRFRLPPRTQVRAIWATRECVLVHVLLFCRGLL